MTNLTHTPLGEDSDGAFDETEHPTREAAIVALVATLAAGHLSARFSTRDDGALVATRRTKHGTETWVVWG